MAEVTAASGGQAFLQAYRDQISLLEKDPNADAAFKEALERQYKAVEDQVGGQPRAEQPPGEDGDENPIYSRSQAEVPPGGGGEDDHQSPTEPPPGDGRTGYRSQIEQPREAPGSAGVASADIPPAVTQLEPYVTEAARLTGLDPNLLMAVIWQESGGENGAVTSNPANGLSDTGIMQINERTFAGLQEKYPELRGKSLSDPGTNILAGAYYLRCLKQQFGSDALALRAYNSGPGSVDRNDPDAIVPPGKGDANYVSSVMAKLRQIENGTPPSA